MTDPGRTITVRAWATRGIAGAALVTLGLWALAPLERFTLPAIDLTRPTSPEPARNAAAAFEIAAFDATIWVPPPAPNKVHAEAPAPPAPFTIELVAIVTEPGGRRFAALYDPTTDELHQIPDEGAIKGYTLDVGTSRVTFSSAGETYTLILDQQRRDG